MCFRYIAVCHPLKAPTLCSRSHFFKVVPVLFLVLLTINSHLFWTVYIDHSYVEGRDVYLCNAKPKFRYLVKEIWPWVDICMYSFLPLLIISILNARIIYCVVRARRNRKQMQLTSNASGAKKKLFPLIKLIWRKGGTVSGGGQQDSSYRVTLMLLTISCTFLMTTLPVSIINISAQFINPRSLHAVARYHLTKTIAHMLMYCNHSINFFLYCATGEKFRQQLKVLFCRGGNTSPRYNQKLYNNGNTKLTHDHNITPNNRSNHREDAEQQLLEPADNIEMKIVGDVKLTTPDVQNNSARFTTLAKKQILFLYLINVCIHVYVCINVYVCIHVCVCVLFDRRG